MKKGMKRIISTAIATTMIALPASSLAANIYVGNVGFDLDRVSNESVYRGAFQDYVQANFSEKQIVDSGFGDIYELNDKSNNIDTPVNQLPQKQIPAGAKIWDGTGTPGDSVVTELKVESVSAINGKQIVVKFNKAVDKNSVVTTAGSSTTLNANIVSVEKTSTDVVANALTGTVALAGNAASLSEDGKELTVTLSSTPNAIFAGSYDVILRNVTSGEVKMANYYGNFSVKDITAPTVEKAEYVTSTGKFKVTLSEPITAAGSASKAVLSINGKPATFDTPSSYPTKSLTVSRPSDVNLGSTATISVAGIEDAAGNLLTPYSGSVVVTNDTTALAVTDITQISNQVVRVTLNKKLDTASNTKILTAAPNNGLVVTKDDGTVTTNYSVAAAPAQFNKDGNVYDITLADATYTTSNTFGTTITFTKDAFTDVTGNKNAVSQHSITLNKDVTAPTVVSSKLSVDGARIELTFSEEVNPTTINNSFLQLRLDGAELQAAGPTVSASIKANTDNKVIEISLSGTAASTAIANGKLKGGSYQVRLTEGFVKDINGVDLKTTNAPLVTIDGGVAEALSATVAGSANVITITAPVGEKFTTASLTNGVFKLNGETISSDADITFTNSSNNVISITLPTEESVKFTGSAAFTATGVALESGKAFNNPYGTVSVVDNTAPVLQNAKILDDKTIELTYSEDIALTGANASVGDEFTIKQGSTLLTLAANELKANAVSGLANKVRLTIAQGADTTGTPAVPASSFAAATNLTNGGSNTATGNMTVTGTFNGTSDETLTVTKTATGYSVDGSNDVTLSGTTFSYKGLTIETSAVVTPATGDTWTISLTAAVAAVPGTSATKLDLTKAYTIETKTPGTADIKDVQGNGQKLETIISIGN